ncbi:MAG: M48 family metallopeptidase [Anaerolineales bacterium]
MVTLDPERQQKAKEYARLRRRLWLVGLLFSLLYAVLWIVSGWGVALRAWLEGFTTNQWLIVPAFVVVFGGIFFLLNLPLTFYEGFILPHRYQLSTQSLKDWLIDQLKSLVLSALIGLPLLELLYLALRVTGDAWWIWAAVGMFFFTVLMVNLGPVLILPLFNKFVPLEAEHADLAQRLTQLAEKAGTRVRGVFKFDMSRRTKAANAALTGIGNTRRIVLGDTLINEFTADEIETVLAHELGHHVHRDVPLLIAFGALVTGVGFYLVSVAMEGIVSMFGFQGAWDVAAFPALMLVFDLYSLFTMPLQNAFSRWRERLADEYALTMTGKPQAFASALTRLANQNLSEVDPERWVVWLFYSHPPLKERIERAQGWPPATPTI